MCERLRASACECVLVFVLTLAPATSCGQRRRSDAGPSGERLLRREAQLLALQHFGDVEIEEVAVEDGLHHARDDGDEVEEALEVVAPDPVEEVEGSVEAEGEEVVAGDGLSLPGLAHEEELRQDRHRLQVDGERPQDLEQREVVVHKHREASDGHDQELDAERVVVAVVRRLELVVDHPERGVSASHVHNLHAGVVDGDEGGEEIKVSSGEHQSEEDLALPRNSSARPRLPYLDEQDDDGEEVGEVTRKSKHVHDAAAAAAIKSDRSADKPMGQ